MADPGAKSRIIYYIDGLNLFHAFQKKGWEEINWLNIVKFCETHVPASCIPDSISVKYYTALFKKHTQKRKAQLTFIEANEKINEGTGKLTVVRGMHKEGSSWCDTCGEETRKMNEKKTDVNIAIQMVEDAVLKDNCEVSVLVSNDTDIVPAINLIKKYKPAHRIVIFVPPNDNVNYDLQDAAGSRNDENVIVFTKGEYTAYKNASLPESLGTTPDFTRPNLYNKEWLIEENRKQKEIEKAKLKEAKAANKAETPDGATSDSLLRLKDKFAKDK